LIVEQMKENVKVLKGKLKAKNEEIADLWELLRKQREINKELRSENITLIAEKVKLRAKAHS